MKRERYFLIAPKAGLVARLTGSLATDLMDLAAPVMWTGDEYDRSYFSSTDMDELVKVLFLDTLRRERGTQKSFAAVFGDWSLSGTYFDAWWSFQRVDVDMSVDIAIRDAIATGSFGSVRGAVNPEIAEWMDEYRQRKNL